MNDTTICAQNYGPVNLAALGDRPDMPLQALKMRLDIYEEAILRTTYGQDGQPVAFDEISPFDLGAAFAGLSVGTGLLPRDCLFCRKAGGDYHVGVYLPPAPRTLRIDGVAEAFSISVPPLVFTGRGTTYCVYALRGPDWPDARSPLYHAPFPNVYGDGRICHGSVDFPACTPATVHAAAALFFDSFFNRDLDNMRSRKHPRAVAEMWRELAEAVEYPVDDLVETNRALGDLVEDGHALR